MLGEKKVKTKKINKDNSDQKAINKEKIVKKNEDKNNHEKLSSHENPKADQVVCKKLAKLMEKDSQSKKQNPNKNDLLNESDFGKKNSKNVGGVKGKPKKYKKRDNSAKIEKKKKDDKNIINNNEEEKKNDKKQEKRTKSESPNAKIQPVEIVFIFNQIETVIQTNMDEIMENVINKFFEKSKIERKNKNFIYSDIVDEKLSVRQIAKGVDIIRKKLNILVIDNSIDESIKEIISKDFICPDCYENIILTLDNYKINYKCKNYFINKKHCKSLMNFDQFEDLQKIDLTKIKCGQCDKLKNEIYNYQFYFCCNCKTNLCPLCYSNHDTSHKILNYDDKNYKCEKHYENFIEYCENCNQNMCFLCRDEHKNHKIINLEMIGKDKIIIELENTKKTINEVKSYVEDLKNKLDYVIKNLENFYTLSKNFVDNYKVENRNYYILQNLKEIRNYNTNLLLELKSISNEKFFSKKFNQIMDIYNKMNAKIEEKVYPDGGIYIGEMKNNLRNGKGKMRYSNDDKYNRYLYEGEWKDDLFDGYGIMYWKNSDFYQGDWKKGLKEGKGIYNFCNGDIYEGEFKNDKKEGKGIYTFNKLNRYEGEMKNDYIEGNGIFYWENGDKYIGEFKKAKAEGKGVQFHVNGEMEMGFFSDGMLVGKYALLNSKDKIKIKTA